MLVSSFGNVASSFRRTSAKVRFDEILMCSTAIVRDVTVAWFKTWFPDLTGSVFTLRPRRQPLWPKLRIRTAYDDINANHENSRNRNDQSRCRPGQSVCDPAERSSRHRGPLPKRQDRSVVLAAGT